MEIGLTQFSTAYTIQPDRLARLAEERGFESLFLPEHTHIPASRATPYPIGGDLPREYSHTFDPFVAAAAVTERIKLGTGVALVIQRPDRHREGGGDARHALGRAFPVRGGGGLES